MQIAPLKFVTVEDFWPGIAELGNITVPKGFVTDLHSTPRILWSIYPPHLMPIEAALIHDYGYRINLKSISDDFYYIALRAYGAPKQRARLFTNAVKLFGDPARTRRPQLLAEHQLNHLRGMS